MIRVSLSIYYYILSLCSLLADAVMQFRSFHLEFNMLSNYQNCPSSMHAHAPRKKKEKNKILGNWVLSAPCSSPHSY